METDEAEVLKIINCCGDSESTGVDEITTEIIRNTVKVRSYTHYIYNQLFP